MWIAKNCFDCCKLRVELKVNSQQSTAPKYLQVWVNLPRLAGAGSADSFEFATDAQTQAERGQWVVVPWGKTFRLGVVAGCTAHTAFDVARIKPVAGVVRDWPALPETLLRLARFAADYYQRSVGEVLLSSLPQMLTRTACFGIEDGVATYTKRQRSKPAKLPIVTRAPARELTAEQQTALQWLAHQNGYACGLLHGVTGSGKTEVYLHAVARYLEQGRSALLLVPEIALTEGLAATVASRFPHETVAVMTSGIADGERARAWLAALRGQARVVVGTRSAVFAPLSNLGLIVVDEEHDASYKQHDGVRLHARDLAVMRAHLSACPVLLGSATPSLESWLNAQTGRYTLLSMPNRAHADATLPSIRLINTAKETKRHGVSESLAAALNERLLRSEQSLVFVNRRGFAPVLQCLACDWCAECDNCTARMVLHRARTHSGYKLICHLCGAQRPVPAACPVCGNQDLLPQGQGTQKVEDSLQQLLPDARIARMDRDSTRKKGAARDILAAMDAGDTDVLVGTQMIAKGHDFARLTLVGVVGTDSLLTSADFRAEERLFALLMQVAGRAGRADKPGEVLIETRQPRHPLFAELLAHDYHGAAARLLAERESLGLPPYTALAVLRIAARSDSLAQTFLNAARTAAPQIEGMRLYRPVPMAVPMVARQARWQLLVEASTRAVLQQFLAQWMPALQAIKAGSSHWHLDVDPLDL